MISKKTYTKVSLPNFAYQIYGDNRVNAFVALISVKYSLEIMDVGMLTSKNMGNLPFNKE